MDNLTLATTRDFNGHTLNCYVEDSPKEKYDFWATREQIGQFLGYNDPRMAIKKIHHRNRERLDQFSTVVKLGGNLKGRAQNDPDLTKNVHPTTIYSFKGLLEICRFSNQPNANKVIDILWDIADEIRRKGFYIPQSVKPKFDALVNECNQLKAENAKLRKFIEDNRSFTVLGQTVTTLHGLISVGEAAKLITQKGFDDIGQNRLYALLRKLNKLCRRKGRQWNQPTQEAIKQGLFNIVLNLGSKASPMLTPKGLQYICDFLTKEKYPLLALMGFDEAVNA